MFHLSFSARFCPKTLPEITRFHLHNDIEFLIPITEGGTLWVEDRVYSLQPGTFFIIGEQVMHHRSAEGVPYDRFILHINADDLYELSSEDLDLRAVFSGQFMALSISEHFTAITDKLRALAHEFPVGAGCELRRGLKCLSFILDICDMMSNIPPAQPIASDPNIARVLSIQNYIRAHCREPLRLDDIAEAFHLNKFYLSHMFKNISDYTILEYISYCRITESCRYLRDGIGTSEAADLSGFQSTEQFTRMFKRWMQTTPAQYRKTYAGSIRIDRR